MTKQNDSKDVGDTATEIRHLSVLMEQTLSEVQVVKEAVSDMQAKVKHIPKIREDVEGLKEDMKLVKSAVKDTNHDLHIIDNRVTKLESARV